MQWLKHECKLTNYSYMWIHIVYLRLMALITNYNNSCGKTEPYNKCQPHMTWTNALWPLMKKSKSAYQIHNQLYITGKILT